MKDIDLLEKYIINNERLKINNNFLVPLNNNKEAFVVASENFMGWNHVSAHVTESTGEALKRTPSNEEMQFLRNLFFRENDVVLEFHPAKKDYVNNHSYVLHMWESTDDKFVYPKQAAWDNISGKVITLPNQKMLNIRRTIKSGWDIVNVRTLNKKKHIAKKYATWDEMCYIKKLVYGEDDVCVQFRYHDMSEDFSINIYKSLDEEIVTPPSILVGSKSFGKIV